MQPSGLHHIILTVSDLKRTRDFYGDLLGFETKVFTKEGEFYFTSGGVMFFFNTAREPIPEDRFNEFRIGLDHLSFSVPTQDALQAMAEKLKAAGVPTNGVEIFKPTGTPYVAFSDPDNIQLEYWLTEK